MHPAAAQSQPPTAGADIATAALRLLPTPTHNALHQQWKGQAPRESYLNAHYGTPDQDKYLSISRQASGLFRIQFSTKRNGAKTDATEEFVTKLLDRFTQDNHTFHTIVMRNGMDAQHARGGSDVVLYREKVKIEVEGQGQGQGVDDADVDADADADANAKGVEGLVQSRHVRFTGSTKM
jgi:hypothetical protein